jgi:hypothetical protein
VPDVDFTATAHLRVGVVPAFGYVQDLTTYPQWFTIVDRVVPEPTGEGWAVDLAARLGPLKRTKRVRMVRCVLEPTARRVVFERHELDGGSHSPWVLSASVAESVPGCDLTMHLHYGGLGWVPGLDLILREEARRAGARLERRLLQHGHLPHRE